MPAGAKPGERRGGREKGTPNKVTIDCKILAQPYTAEAIKVFVTVLQDKAQPAHVRLKAGELLLDRACGKPSQALAVGGDASNLIPIRQIIHQYVTETGSTNAQIS